MENSIVEAVVWVDKKPVHFLNTLTNPQEFTQIPGKQYDGTNAVVNCLVSVKMYNQFLGGIDLQETLLFMALT